MIGLSAFANKGEEVSKQAVNAFTKDFAGARNISWEQTNQFVKATFTINDEVMCAFYTNGGELQAVVRNILSDKLPINLLASLKKEYNGFWISELFEMASDDQTTYYVTLESADKTLVLRSVGTNGWNVFSKTRKEAE